MSHLKTICLMAVVLVTTTYGDEVKGVYRDLPTCDNHGDRSASEELGDPSVFSAGQQIDHVATFTDVVACDVGDNPNIPNSLVVVTNRTKRHWRDLYYVGDPSTSFSNVDGFGDAGVSPNLSGLAFRIDSVGDNRPLVFESLTPDNVFEPGEEWRFVVQDYASPLGPADSFFSVGFADASVTPFEVSAASIVQFVPEPAFALQLLAGVVALVVAQRRTI